MRWLVELTELHHGCFCRDSCGGETRVHSRSHIYPLCGIFYFPWHRHQIEGDLRLLVFLLKDTGRLGEQSCLSFETVAHPGLLDRQSGALTSEPLHPTHMTEMYRNSLDSKECKEVRSKLPGMTSRLWFLAMLTFCNAAQEGAGRVGFRVSSICSVYQQTHGSERQNMMHKTLKQLINKQKTNVDDK